MIIDSDIQALPLSTHTQADGSQIGGVPPSAYGVEGKESATGVDAMTNTRLTLTSIGTILGIIVTVATGVNMVRGNIQAQEDLAVTRATTNAKRDADLNARLDEIQRHLKFIDSTLSKRDRELAGRVFTSSLDKSVRGASKEILVRGRWKPDMVDNTLQSYPASAPKEQKQQ